MITFTGKAIFPKGHEHHTGEAPEVADIAIGLARHLRFAGQVPHEYSVLCHTLCVAQLVSDENRIHALLHDAAEAFVGDIPSTLKTKAQHELEKQIVETVYENLGLAWPPSDDAITEVSLADHAALAAEAHALGHTQAQRWWPREEFNKLAEEALRITHQHISEGWTQRLRSNLPDAVGNYQRFIAASLPGRKAAEVLLSNDGKR